MTESDVSYLLDRLDSIQALLMFFAVVIIGFFVYRFFKIFF